MDDVQENLNTTVMAVLNCANTTVNRFSHMLTQPWDRNLFHCHTVCMQTHDSKECHGNGHMAFHLLGKVEGC